MAEMGRVAVGRLRGPAVARRLGGRTLITGILARAPSTGGTLYSLIETIPPGLMADFAAMSFLATHRGADLPDWNQSQFWIEARWLAGYQERG